MSKNTIYLIVKLILSVFFVGLIIWGQRSVGYLYLGAQFLGLCGLLVLLYVYNKAYR